MFICFPDNYPPANPASSKIKSIAKSIFRPFPSSRGRDKGWVSGLRLKDMTMAKRCLEKSYWKREAVEAIS